MRAQQRIHFFKNVSMLGGLMIAAADTEAKPGRRLADPPRRADARREARHLAHGRAPRGEARQGQADLSHAATVEPALAGPARDRSGRRGGLAARQQVADQPGAAARGRGRRSQRRTAARCGPATPC